MPQSATFGADAIHPIRLGVIGAEMRRTTAIRKPGIGRHQNFAGAANFRSDWPQRGIVKVGRRSGSGWRYAFLVERNPKWEVVL